MKLPATFTTFAARLREFIQAAAPAATAGSGPDAGVAEGFDELAQALFALQFEHCAPLRRLCQVRGLAPAKVEHWRQIPALPVAAFKAFEVSCLPAAERTRVFCSSGTSGQRPSRHFHHAESLALYEASVCAWFARHLLTAQEQRVRILCLTPPPEAAPTSSLVHMFATVQRAWGEAVSPFTGVAGRDGTWLLDLERTFQALRAACEAGGPLLVLGTAFSFVHLLDALAARRLRLALPAGSRVLETGGYKGRTRARPQAELHGELSERLGVPAGHIIGEYGMAELSSQAYDRAIPADPRVPVQEALSQGRLFRFPPWARAQVVSPETGAEVAEGETGLLRIVDLANVWSVLAIQTEDVGRRRAGGFELLGRSAWAEPRGCSLRAAESSPGA